MTSLTDLVHRAPIPLPWAEGDNIPWHDPEFSQRMLREHLSQAHDAASRSETTLILDVSSRAKPTTNSRVKTTHL